MITISLCMIVKDEQEVLARCLDSVKGIADEIIIVDTGSTDDTVKIAKKYTDKVYHFQWIDDFSAARNESFSHATMDYIMWLDADDIIDEENRQKLLRLKADFPADVDVAMLLYNTAFDQNGNCTFHYRRERLVRREKGYRWCEPVHECIDFHGVAQEYDIAITHGEKARNASSRNIDIYRNIVQSGRPLSIRSHYYYARELKTHGMYEEAVTQYRLFFEAQSGWVEDMISAAEGLSVCLQALGRNQEALEELFKSFSYSLPRAEICCQIGYIYLNDNRLDESAFWYEMALKLPRPGGWGFITEDAWGFLPHLQLCVVYFRKGDSHRALEHHKATLAINPEDAAVKYNQQYFMDVGMLNPV